MIMRAQVLLVALLSAAPGHSLLPSPPSGSPPAPPSPMPGLAPSPYVPELAPDPFGGADITSRAAPHAPIARRRAASAPLAPSPYVLDLVPNPYTGSSPSRSMLAVATAPAVLAVSLTPRVLAPSPYEPLSPNELAPSPY